MAHHDLKCWIEFFKLTWAHCKPVEIRKDDRNYKVQDTMTLNEYDMKNGKYCGRKIHGTIWAVCKNVYGVQEGFVMIFYDETGRDVDGIKPLIFEDDKK